MMFSEHAEEAMEEEEEYTREMIREMERVVQLDEYGYLCSSCGGRDSFNEEELLRDPPVDILTIMLLQKYNREDGADVTLLQQRSSKRQCVLSHTLPCARKAKHLPVPCEETSTDACFRFDHFRYCPGFFKVKLSVEYKVLVICDDEGDVIPTVCNVRVAKILPNLDIVSGIERGPSFEEFENDDGFPVSYSEDGDETSTFADILKARTRCRAVMDFLFCHDCSFRAINGFTYLTHPDARRGILQENIIIQRDITMHTKHIQKHTLTGVMLHCNGDHLSFTSSEEYKSRALFIQSENVCRNLFSKRKAFTPKLYFHSYEIFRGAFGKQKIHVTLVVLTKSSPDLQEFCEQHLEPLSIRTNPFLQISPCLKVIRKAETMDPSVGLYVRLLFASNFLLSEATNFMNQQ